MANKRLPITIRGVTQYFKGNGRKLGYPTANIYADTSLDDGIYFGFATLASFLQKPSLVFIGQPRTLGDLDRRIEVHILDIPDVDYYDRKIEIEVLHFHRKNEVFNTIDELVFAMQGDELAARVWFKE